jgi:hypothetical protein
LSIPWISTKGGLREGSTLTAINSLTRRASQLACPDSDTASMLAVRRYRRSISSAI